MKFRIHVPATSANLGPGFDALGLALSLGNDFIVSPAERSTVTGCEERYAGPDNLFLLALEFASARLGISAPCLSLDIDAGIPLARGLGSSAAMIAGGVTAALLFGTERDQAADLTPGERRFILETSAAMEGHPDNVCPAVMGGFCVAVGGMDKDDPLVWAGCDVASDWSFHALIPPFELPTREARAALPSHYSRADAVFNLGRASLVAMAFAQKNPELLGAACRDRLHQPWRSGLIPGYDTVAAACREAGASALWLSGAGPTIMAVTAGVSSSEKFSAKMAATLATQPEGPWRHLVLAVDFEGVRHVRLETE
jgi:homoserine kinase